MKKAISFLEIIFTLSFLWISTGHIALAQQGYHKIMLEQDLEIGNNNSQILFDYLIDLDIDDRDRIYIPDLGSRTIYVFSGQGKLLEEVGRGGQGPGEFQILRDIAVRNQKLYIFDPTLFRISVFETENNTIELSKTINMPKEGPFKKSPAWMWVSANDNIFISYESGYSRQNLDEKKYKSIFRFNIESLELSDKPLLKIPDRQYLIIKKGSGFSVNSNIPLARKPVLDFGQNEQVIYGWNGGNKIKIYDLSGRLRNTFPISYKVVEVTGEEKNRLAKANGLDTDELTNDAYEQIHDTFPVYDWFLTDDEGQIWIAVNTENRQFYSLRVYSHEGDLIGKTELTKKVELKAVRNEYAYGIRENKNGVQSVVRYKINGF